MFVLKQWVHDYKLFNHQLIHLKLIVEILSSTSMEIQQSKISITNRNSMITTKLLPLNSYKGENQLVVNIIYNSHVYIDVYLWIGNNDFHNNYNIKLHSTAQNIY